MSMYAMHLSTSAGCDHDHYQASLWLYLFCCPTGSEVAVVNEETIRHRDCEVFVWNQGSNRYKVCNKYRNTFTSDVIQMSEAVISNVRVDKRSKMNNRYRTPSEIMRSLEGTKKFREEE